MGAVNQCLFILEVPFHVHNSNTLASKAVFFQVAAVSILLVKALSGNDCSAGLCWFFELIGLIRFNQKSACFLKLVSVQVADKPSVFFDVNLSGCIFPNIERIRFRTDNTYSKTPLLCLPLASCLGHILWWGGYEDNATDKP